MANPLFNPFTNLRFNNNTCFLSGQKLDNDAKQISVFPEWLMQQYQLHDKAFKLLDESISTYKDLLLPCSEEVAKAFDVLDKEVKEAFERGYDALQELPSQKLFLWTGKIVYGIIYNEIVIGIRQQRASAEAFNLSQALQHKFKNLHLMLQSLILPMEFEGNSPWSIHVFKVENAENVFNYRDEINTLTFSLSMGDFGMMACLQDNGTNSIYHRELLDKAAGQVLHPIQFEEIIARFYYSAYLFNRLPEYTVMPVNNTIYIEAMPLRGISNKPLFDNWQVKPYAQVLENFWKPWGITLFEIIKDPDNPLSFVESAEGEWISAEKVVIPTV